MTRTELSRRLGAWTRTHDVAVPSDLPPDDPAWREVLEAACERAPEDGDLRALLLDLHTLAQARDGLPATLGGVRLAEVVRADAWSVTLTGHDTARGEAVLIRTVRGPFRRDPLLRRQLARDGRALRAVLPGLEHEEEAAALVLRGVGPARVPTGRGPLRDAFDLGGFALRTLAGLAARERAGLGVPQPEPAELRDPGDRFVLACLHPDAHAPAEGLAHLADALVALAPDPNHAVAVHLDAWRTAPPSTAREAARALVSDLGEHLAATRHALVRGRAAGATKRQRDRLARALAALDAGLPPPHGRGVVGVDLEGRPLVAASDGRGIRFGPEGEAPAEIWDPEDGLDVAGARRLVRVRGGSPPRRPSPDDPEASFVDALTRWVAAALELRALRRLLDATDPG